MMLRVCIVKDVKDFCLDVKGLCSNMKRKVKKGESNDVKGVCNDRC